MWAVGSVLPDRFETVSAARAAVCLMSQVKLLALRSLARLATSLPWMWEFNWEVVNRIMRTVTMANKTAAASMSGYFGERVESGT